MLNYEVLYDKIVYFPEIIPNVQELIEKIEALNSHAISPWGVWYASGNSTEHAYGEVKSFNKNLLQQETDPAIKTDCEYVIDSLISAMSLAAKKYAEIYNINKEDLDYAVEALNHLGTRYGINKYYENQYMGPHVDWNEFNSEITYTIVVYLNDNYEGGALKFVRPEIDLKIKSKAGSIVMFPSVEPYLHQSENIPSGRKMLITHHWKTNPNSSEGNS